MKSLWHPGYRETEFSIDPETCVSHKRKISYNETVIAQNISANITLFFVIFSCISFEFESWRSWLKSDWCIEAYTV